MSNAQISRPSRLLAGGLARITVGLCAALLLTTAGAQELTEGKQYARIRNPLPVETGKNIEVIEFFSYACPHCGELEPHIQAWLKSKPADVTFRRVPVLFQQKWEPLAKMYYTLEAMGEDARLSPEIFVAVHGQGAQLFTDKAIFDWVATKGVDRKKFEDIYNSFAINGKLSRAKQVAQAYGVQSVPMVIVDGKFVTASERVGSHAQMPAAMTGLTAKARAERPKS